MATLAAAIIVGKNEAFELRRLLESIKGPLFDEICVTTTQGDPEVEAVANELATKVSSFTWVDDFSAARNFSFSQATTTHVMWLDSDDILTPENYQAIEVLKRTELDSLDMVLMSYYYGHDQNGKPNVVLPRERIVRNDLSRIKWHDPIHEYLNMDGGLRILSRNDIGVSHMRMKPYNGARNLAIHKRCWESGTMSPRQMFYYAKDLMDSNEHDNAAVVFDKYLSGPTDFVDNKAVACIRMASYYRDIKNDHDASASYLRKGMMYSSAFAEFPYFLGIYYRDVKKDNDAAIRFFTEAAGKPLSAGMSMQAEFYEYMPSKMLSFLWYEKGEYEKALHYCERALKANPADQHCQHNIGIITKAVETKKASEAPILSADRSFLWLLPVFNPVDPSQRIRRLNVHKAMISAGIKSELMVDYHGVPDDFIVDKAKDFDIAVFCSFTEKDRALMKALSASGKKVVLDYNEAIHTDSAVIDTIQTADLVVCCSTKLAEMVQGVAKAVAVVPDPVEASLEGSETHSYLRKDRDKLVALYIGMGGNSFLVTDHLRSTIEDAGYTLKVCTEWDNADIRWDMDTWEDVMKDADVILCPQRIDVQPAKSNVKVTQAMALGIPVIASKLKSYTEVIHNGVNGYLANGKKEWSEALLALKNDYKRIQVGMNAASSVDGYKLPSIASLWAKVSKELYQLPKSTAPQVAAVEKPKDRTVVPIIIPVYNQLEYLKLCLTSIQMNTTHPYHIILSDAGSNAETWEYLRNLKGITVLGAPGQRLNFSEACNAGIRNSSGRFFTILNSDVIVSKGWLEPLVDQMENGGRIASCGVLSNCDRGWLHNAPGLEQYPMRLLGAGIELVPGMKTDQIVPHLDELDQFMTWSNQQHAGKFVPQQWVAAYATIFARCAIDEVGLFDTGFKNGCEDLDLCQRLKVLGYSSGQRIDSFVFHFGGVSRGHYQQENIEAYNAEDRFNHERFAAKWAKKRIAIFTGQAWEKWNRDTVDSGMAGSETWAAELAAEFSRRGFDTHLFGDPITDGEIDRDGVTYHHYGTYADWSQYLYVDHLILSRTCEPIKHIHMHALRTDVMVHDIWLSQDPNYDKREWMVSKFACLSDWHSSFFSKHHSVPANKILDTANGVRSELYADVDVSAKKNRAVYSSSPDRGLLQLLLMVPEIRKTVPDFELDVAYGYHNWESAAKLRNIPEELQMIEQIKELTRQPGVNYLGRISKAELAKKQKEAKLWLYPTWFTETFGITAVEAGMAKNAVVTTPLAGLLTVLGGSANYITGPQDVPVEQWSFTQQYQEAFVLEAIRLLTDEQYRRECADKVHEKVSSYTWGNVADGWLAEWSRG